MTDATRRIAAWGAILAIGALLRLWGLGTESFWHDESWTWLVIRGSVRDLFRTLVEHDAHPPLYYLLVRGWSLIFNDTEAALRLLSAAAGIAALPVMFRLGRRFGDEKAGLVAMGLLAIAPLHVYFSQEARSYALLFLLCALSIEALFNMRERPNRDGVILLTLVTAGIMYTHYMGAFFVLAEAVVVAKLGGREFTRGCAIAAACAFALYLPWLPTFLRHVTSVSGSFWIPSPTAGIFLRSMGDLAAYPYGIWAWLAWTVSIPIWLAALAAPFITRKREHGALLLLVLIPIAGELLVSLARPIFYTRTFLYVLAPLTLLAPATITRLPRRAPALAALLLALCAYPGLRYIHMQTEKEDWREVVRFLDREAAGYILVHPPFVDVNLQYYTRESKRAYGIPTTENGLLPRGHHGIPYPRIWLIIRHGVDDGWARKLESQYELGKVFKRHGAEVYEYRRLP
jgi:4-amino-4-deoxy-L-arabinose transferase-like glycosyltransferase